MGALIAVGTSICGVTAIIAAAPAIDADEQETTYAVSVITIFGLLATLAFPYLANWLFQGDGLKAGLFLGTAVHDTSQVVGAAKVYADVFSQPAALEVATVTKLVRNTFMMLVIPYLAFNYSKRNPQAGQNRQSGRITRLLPLFILGFVLMAVLRSAGDAGINNGGNALGWFSAGEWTVLIAWITSWAENLLVVALAGMGLSTNLRMMQGLGIKPFLVGLGASLSVSVVSYFRHSAAGEFGHVLSPSFVAQGFRGRHARRLPGRAAMLPAAPSRKPARPPGRSKTRAPGR